MYNWRTMSPEQQTQVLALRKLAGRPWHGPPHRMGETTIYHLTAANYEHQPIIGMSPVRMGHFEKDLLEAVAAPEVTVMAWCVLPNHYHLLLDTPDVLKSLAAIGQLHGSHSRCWNLEDGTPGRKCWHRAVERGMKTERHQWATLNYVHHNPVHHGYVTRWQDWPYSSAVSYLEAVGNEEARRIWSEFPVLDYGAGWDDPRL